MYVRDTKGAKVWFAVGKGDRVKIIEMGKAVRDGVPNPGQKGRPRSLQRAQRMQ